MQKMKMLTLLFLLLITSPVLFGQQNRGLIKEGAPNIFIDCSYCDINFIKEQIPVVNYVRDRKDADVHILFTSQSTGSGGTSYTLLFIGQNKFEGLKDTVKFNQNKTDSDDDARIKTVKAIKMGLVRYLSRTQIADQMDLIFPVKAEPSAKSAAQPKDDWDFWIFKLSSSGFFNDEKNYSSKSIYSSVSANRTTEDLKISLSLSNSYNENKYIYETSSGDEKILNITRSQYADASMIKAINEKWSWGIWGSWSSSTYNNIKSYYSLAPGIEYNIFPYAESNVHQFRIYYKLFHSFTNYDEETIYYKTKENLWQQSLSASLSLIEPWGNLSFGSAADNYLNDFESIGYNFFSSANLRIFK